MLLVLFKLAISFLFITILAFMAKKVSGDLFNFGIIDDKYEEKVLEITTYISLVFGGLMIFFFVVWVLGAIWCLR